ncbi:MAG: outer membrane protein assembly factor BamA [Endomicrobium sp.]|jgi:outer membrane protein insertion porin family|nr:outer membrane protein assembly factor BamA [Endomicrobium sp.]
MRRRFLFALLLMFLSVFVYADDDSKKLKNENTDPTANLKKSTDIISEVLIEGLKNVKARRVLPVVKLKKGKYYSNDIAREDVRSILKLGDFDNVEFKFDRNCGKFVFVVIEKPYIESVIFKGNSEFSKRKLRSMSALKEKDYYDVLKLEETKKKISTLYGDNGYADCQIEVYPTVDVDTNKMTVTFLITENNKMVIGSVDIEGAVYFKGKKILKVMKTKPKKIFKEDIYQNDLKSIEKFYKDNGFMDYSFISSTTVYNDARTEVFLKLNISESVKYKINSVAYDGNFAVDDKEMKKIIKIKKGQIFNQNRITETVQSIFEIYLDKGYLHAEIIPSFSKGDTEGLVDMNLSIKENSITYVGNIYIDGLVSTKDKAIRRELLLKTGDMLSVGKVRRSVEKIYNLGFIEKADPQVLPSQVADVMDLSFSITESKPGMFSTGVGYSSVDEFIGSLQLQHMNLFGLAQKLNFLCEFGSKKQNYQIEWKDPWVFNKNINLTLSAFDINRRRDYKDDNKDAYNEHKIGGMAGVSRRFNDYISLLFVYKYEYVKLLNIKEDVKYEVDKINPHNPSKISSISPGIKYDSRDYIFDPSKGNRQFANIEIASDLLGGEENFVKGIVMSSWYFPTFWKLVLSVNFECGVIKGHKIPGSEKFYLGGADTIRGYKYRTEIGSPNGGEVKGLINVEYKFPIVSEKGRTIVQGLLFYDIGGVWENCSDVNLHLGTSSKNLRSGVGFGIRFVTPIFPLRLDWGYGLNHEKREPLQQFYFNIGNIF